MIQGKRILVTGGSGFLGRYVCREVQARDPRSLCVPRSSQFDLRLSGDVEALMELERPQVVIHLAANVGGIGLNLARPGDLCGDNLAMGVNLIRAAAQFECEKFVLVGTACSYPLNAPMPIKEESLHDGYPEPTNAPYGLAKRMLAVMLDAYRRQYGFNGITVIPANLYGPGDKFDDASSHVIPAIIKKIRHAVQFQDDTCADWSVKLWGSGRASRDFLYAEDAARGIIAAVERYNGPEPVNLGSGREVAISQVAAMLAREMGYYGGFAWDPEQPDGQPRRCLDVTRARVAFGWVPSTGLTEGLRETVRWYLSQGSHAA